RDGVNVDAPAREVCNSGRWQRHRFSPQHLTIAERLLQLGGLTHFPLMLLVIQLLAALQRTLFAFTALLVGFALAGGRRSGQNLDRRQKIAALDKTDQRDRVAATVLAATTIEEPAPQIDAEPINTTTDGARPGKLPGAALEALQDAAFGQDGFHLHGTRTIDPVVAGGVRHGIAPSSNASGSRAMHRKKADS